MHMVTMFFQTYTLMFTCPIEMHHVDEKRSMLRMTVGLNGNMLDLVKVFFLDSLSDMQDTSHCSCEPHEQRLTKQIEKLPRLLLINVKFTEDGGNLVKGCMREIQAELDLSPFMDEKKRRRFNKHVYHLLGLVEFQGETLGTCTYTSVFKRNGKWYRQTEDSTEEIDISSCLSACKPSLVLYELMNLQ